MRKFLTLSLIGLSMSVFGVAPAAAQNLIRDLNGFRLGQNRAVTQRELGQPDKKGDTDENVEYDAYVINEEPMLYMVFQYQKSMRNVIWSIQITGDDPKHDLGFRGLKMGLSPTDVEKILGKPSKRISAGEHGSLWEFDKANYSVELNPLNKLSSVRIQQEWPTDPDLKNFPKFSDVLRTLQTGTNAELSDLVAPDMEIYEGEKVRTFEWAMKNEIARDSSSIFATLRRLSKELLSVDTSKTDEYEERLRVRPGKDPLHVIRLHKLQGIKEIAFRWNGERWQIWEFGARKEQPAPQDWRSIYTPGSLKEIQAKRIPDLIKAPNIALNKDDGKPLASFSYNSYPTSTKVKFTGETRKTAETTLTLISLWLEMLGKSKDLAKRFEFEFKVVEDDVEYWLPLQHPLPERLSKETKKDGEITIYLAWIGVRYEGDRPVLLAIVNEFEASPKSR